MKASGTFRAGSLPRALTSSCMRLQVGRGFKREVRGHSGARLHLVSRQLTPCALSEGQLVKQRLHRASTVWQTLNSSRRGSMSWNLRSLGRPPTLWWLLMVWECLRPLPGGGQDSITSGYSVPCVAPLLSISDPSRATSRMLGGGQRGSE